MNRSIRRAVMSAVALACLSGFAAAPARAAATAASAEAFVKHVYTVNDDVLGPHMPLYFDPSLVALKHENDALLHGKLGGLDFSPLCWCQMSKDTTQTIGPAELTGPGSATVTVTYTSAGKLFTKVILSLVAVNGAWRIHDISGESAPDMKMDSMTAILRKSNAMLSNRAR